MKIQMQMTFSERLQKQETRLKAWREEKAKIEKELEAMKYEPRGYETSPLQWDTFILAWAIAENLNCSTAIGSLATRGWHMRSLGTARRRATVVGHCIRQRTHNQSALSLIDHDLVFVVVRHVPWSL